MCIFKLYFDIFVWTIASTTHGMENKLMLAFVGNVSLHLWLKVVKAKSAMWHSQVRVSRTATNYYARSKRNINVFERLHVAVRYSYLLKHDCKLYLPENNGLESRLDLYPFL